MPFEIIRETPKPRLMRMGQAPQPIESRPFDHLIPISQTAIDDAGPKDDFVEQELAKVVTPPVKETKPRGRPKKMADKKLDQESGGPEIIRQDDAGEKCAIGSHGENVPAQEKGGSETDKGGKEGE